ncbi:hypothetical protein ACFOKI_08465 [Sphingomonas qilianensis]
MAAIRAVEHGAGVRRNQLTQLVIAGARAEALRLCHTMFAEGDDPIRFLDDRFMDCLRGQDIHRAGEYAALLSTLLWGSQWLREEDGPPVFPNQTRVFLTASKLRHDWEQISYLRARGILGDQFEPILAHYQKLIEAMRPAGRETPREVPTPLDPENSARIGHVYNRILHRRSTPRVPRALSASWSAGQVEDEYLASRCGIAIVDEFLSRDALESLRLFCLESTVWSGNRYNHGRLGAFFRDGFNCPLLLQVAEELRDALPRVIGRNYPLQQLWAFKIGQPLPADSTIHADFAAINVNFWITPTSANRDESSGGMVIYDAQAPLNWNFDFYNGNLDAIGAYLQRKQASSIRVPYRQNRAIIFNSDLFHATEAVDFDPDYENHRINITMLFGYRHQDMHHLDSRLDPAAPRPALGASGWRSAAFRR